MKELKDYFIHEQSPNEFIAIRRQKHYMHFTNHSKSRSILFNKCSNSIPISFIHEIDVQWLEQKFGSTYKLLIHL